MILGLTTGSKESEVKSLSRVLLFATPWTAAHQALPSMGFSRQEYWTGLPLPSPTIVYYYSATKRNEVMPFCSSMDGPRDYHTKQSNSETERQMSYDITYMWNLKYDTNEPICETETYLQT